MPELPSIRTNGDPIQKKIAAAAVIVTNALSLKQPPAVIPPAAPRQFNRSGRVILADYRFENNMLVGALGDLGDTRRYVVFVPSSSLSNSS